MVCWHALYADVSGNADRHTIKPTNETTDTNTIYNFLCRLSDHSFADRYFADRILDRCSGFNLPFIFALRQVSKSRTDRIGLTLILKTINILCSLIVFGLLGLNLINPFAWDTFKLRCFYFQSVDGRLFNAYFKPVGAYSGGYGNFWITETPKYFPVVEWRVYWDRTVHHDFNDDTFDGQPIDNYEVVRSYIKDDVIDKQK